MYKLIYDNVVEIQDGLDPPARLNRDVLLQVIEYIEQNRHEYATDEAHKRQLEKFRGALAFLDSHLNISPT